MKQKVLAIVPARAGSKRLPKKNIKPLNGLPLIAHTFEAIKQSEYITATIATSDCPEVLRVSEQYKNTYPLNRPSELASDTASSIDVIKHAVEYAQEAGINFDIICLLQPTSPLRTFRDVDGAIELYFKQKAKCVISMSQCSHSPIWSTKLERHNDFSSFLMGVTSSRSQDLTPFYQLNGAIYLVDKHKFLEKSTLFLTEDCYPFIMDPEHSIDIDSMADFLFAEALTRALLTNRE